MTSRGLTKAIATFVYDGEGAPTVTRETKTPASSRHHVSTAIILFADIVE